MVDDEQRYPAPPRFAIDAAGVAKVAHIDRHDEVDIRCLRYFGDESLGPGKLGSEIIGKVVYTSYYGVLPEL